jgi:hypothetical protein
MVESSTALIQLLPVLYSHSKRLMRSDSRIKARLPVTPYSLLICAQVSSLSKVSSLPIMLFSSPSEFEMKSTLIMLSRRWVLY